FLATEVVTPMEKFDSESAKCWVFQIVECVCVNDALDDSLYRNVSPAITLPDFCASSPASFSTMPPAPPETSNFVLSLLKILYPSPPAGFQMNTMLLNRSRR